MQPLGARILRFLAKESKHPLPKTFDEIPPPFDVSRGNPFAPVKHEWRRSWRKPKYSLREQNLLRREVELLGWPENVLPPAGVHSRVERTQHKSVVVQQQLWLDNKARNFIREQLMKHWASGSGAEAADEVGSSGGMPQPDQIRTWANDVNKYNKAQARRDELFSRGDTRAAENELLDSATLDIIEQEVDPIQYARLRHEAVLEEQEQWKEKTASKNRRLALIRMWVDRLRATGQLESGEPVPNEFFTSAAATQAATANDTDTANVKESDSDKIPEFPPKQRSETITVNPSIQPYASHLNVIRVPSHGPYEGRPGISFKGKRSERTRAEREQKLKKAVEEIPQTVNRFRQEKMKKK